MLLEYCDMLNVENLHLHDSNEELSCQVLRLKTALETLEARVLQIDHRMEHCLMAHTSGGRSPENPFTLDGESRILSACVVTNSLP